MYSINNFSKITKLLLELGDLIYGNSEANNQVNVALLRWNADSSGFDGDNKVKIVFFYGMSLHY